MGCIKNFLNFVRFYEVLGSVQQSAHIFEGLEVFCFSKNNETRTSGESIDLQ